MNGIVVSLAVSLNENTISFAFENDASAHTDRLQKPQLNYGSG